MWLQKYLQTIDKVDPNKIYIENVKSVFKVPAFVARLMCEMAVVDKVFIKKVGIICPNSDCNRIIASFHSVDEMPDEITCDICESDDREKFTYNPRALERIEFYKLNKG